MTLVILPDRATIAYPKTKPVFHLTGARPHRPENDIYTDKNALEELAELIIKAHLYSMFEDKEGLLKTIINMCMLCQSFQPLDYDGDDHAIWGYYDEDSNVSVALEGVPTNISELEMCYRVDVTPVLERMSGQRTAELGPVPSLNGPFAYNLALHPSLRITPEFENWVRNEASDTQVAFAVAQRSDFIPTVLDCTELEKTPPNTRNWFQLGLEIRQDEGPIEIYPNDGLIAWNKY